MTDAQKEAAKALEAIGWTIDAIAKSLGVHFNSVRAVLDEAYRKQCAESARKMAEKMRGPKLRPRIVAMPEHEQDLTARWLGDPPKGRSALDMRGGRT